MSHFDVARRSPCVALLLGLMLATTLINAQEFPELDKLPSIAELPNPLLMFDGAPVATAEQWQTKRKPELKALFQHYMYGYLPAAPPIAATVVSADKNCLGGKATRKQIMIAFGPPECPKIDLALFVPNKRTDNRPSAVFLGLNFHGNHTVLGDPGIALSTVWMPDGPGVVEHRATEATRGQESDRWQIEHVIDRGYALATFYYGDVMPDKPDFTDGVWPFVGKAGQTERSPTDCGAIALWAWGLHRAVDYLATDPEVDAKRIVLFGHSRNGKAALLSAAYDDRVAAVIAHQAGCGGSAPSRRKNPDGESVTAINDRFPHWFDDVFKRFKGQEDRLPFDQHCLVALCAPRPVLLSNGHKDKWADPPGQFDVLLAARPVYRLLGVDGLPDNVAAPENDKLVGGQLCYFVRDAPHTVDRAYWDVFLDFADHSLQAKPPR